MKKPKVVIDATPLLFPQVGVSRMLQDAFEAVLNLNPPIDWVLYSRCFERKPINNIYPKAEQLHFPVPRIAESWIKKLSLIERFSKGDIFHATDHQMPLGRPEKSIITVHDLIFLLNPEEGWEAHHYFAKVVPNLLNSCHVITTPSEHTKNDIINHLGIPAEKIIVCPWGINTELFHPKSDVEIAKSIREKYNLKSKFFLAVGCSMGRKNTPRLLRAFSRHLQTSPNSQLVLLWTPPEEIQKKYQKEIDRHQILFLPKVSDLELAELYRQSEAAFYPSLYEGFGCPVIEAMACGTPVMTGRNSSLIEVGGDVAFFVDAENEDDILDKIHEISKSKEKLTEASEKGIAHASKFSWENYATKICGVYDSVYNEVIS